MGFSFRDSISVGPFRFNLSGSGIGASVGVRGFRVGAGPRGSYVSVSSHGLTYRTALGRPGDRARPARLGPGSAGGAQLQEITSGDVLEMADSDSGDLLEQLNGALRASTPMPAVLTSMGVIAFLTAIAVFNGALAVPAIDLPAELRAAGALGSVVLVLLGGAFLLAGASARRRFRTRNTAVLMFEVDQAVELQMSNLYDGLEKLGACRGLWHVGSQGASLDPKRNAGASTLVARTPVRLTAGDPIGASTNVTVLHLPAGRERLYFMPDHLLVYDRVRRQYGAVSYSDLEVDLATTRFIEGERVPEDTEVVDETWEKVNRDGSPDRRFASNRRLPVCRYGELTLSSSSGLREMFQFSRAGAADQLVAALSALSARSKGSSAPPDAPTLPPDHQGLNHQQKLLAMAFATLLKYVAVGDRKFDDREREVIRSALTAEFHEVLLVREHLDELIEGATAEAQVVRGCIVLLAACEPLLKRRLFAYIAALAATNGRVTPKERERVREIELGLGLA